jgi:hypothetical protein
MTTLLRLLILAPLAYVIALIAAAATVTIGLFAGQIDGDTAPFALGVAIGVFFYAGLITFIPALIAVILAETFGWRSLLFYLAAGGAIGFIAGETTMAFDGLAFADDLRFLCVAGGFVAGAVYWLIAGNLGGPEATAAGDDRNREHR